MNFMFEEFYIINVSPCFVLLESHQQIYGICIIQCAFSLFTHLNANLICRGIGQGGQIGLSIQGPHVKRAHKDTRMIRCGCGDRPVEDAHVQGPEFCATLLLKNPLDSFNQIVWSTVSSHCYPPGGHRATNTKQTHWFLCLHWLEANHKHLILTCSETRK